jgi:flagellar basal body rod protein FlgG
MAGGHYTALSGMRTQLDALDRLASDIANVSTAGYKGERGASIEAGRPNFGAALQSAVDVTPGPTRLDFRAGALATTGGNLDLAIEGNGFFVVDTPAGERYTRNGRLSRGPDGVLTTPEGFAIQGDSGSISVGTGEVVVDSDGTVRHAGALVGRIKVVQFDENAKLVREESLGFRNDGSAPAEVEKPAIRAGALEQSNVSVVERMAELTTVSRSFEALQRALSVLVNDVDSRAITELGRR